MNRVIARTLQSHEYTEFPDDDIIVCRCEEITKGEIRRAVYDGMINVHEVRRFLRCGMGLCQGQTCAQIVKGIIARELNISPGDLEDATARAPMRPVEMSIFANEGVSKE